MEIKKAKKLSGSLAIPGDKSISHRAVMFGSLAEGTTKITNFLEGADCLSTISCFRKMGINIENTKERSWSTEKVSMVSVLRQRLLTSVTRYHHPPHLRDPCRTGLCIRAYRRCFHPETPYETDHDSAFPNGCRYHKSQRKRMCTA